ncbi:MAG: rhomboid family intramembrane serine protease, partial [Ruminococcus sp.]|nr:rhomboid family intramembrane serine protease [Ruminococcus sp.]
IIGPLLEEKYGKADMIMIIAVTALVTGLINFIFFPHIQLLGASGIVFAFILLSSFTSFQNGKIPVTFILVAVIYIGQQIYSGVFEKNNISELTHIIGGVVGSAFGFAENKIKR